MLIKPEISAVLRSAGITRNGLQPNFTDSNDSVSSKLDAAGLSVQECFESLRMIVDGGDTDTVKLNAVKTALEAHRIMKGDGGSLGTQVNIIINDPHGPSMNVNPILLPRELTA